MSQEEIRNYLLNYMKYNPTNIKLISSEVGIDRLTLARFLIKKKGIHPTTWRKLEVFIQKIDGWRDGNDT